MIPPPRPRVILSWAQSADGRIATRTGDSKYLSSPESLEIQQELRRDCDAVLVGIGTALADDPRLLCRLSPERNPRNRQPLRVVLDSRFRLPPESVLARTARDFPVLVIGAETEEAAMYVKPAGSADPAESSGGESVAVESSGGGAASRKKNLELAGVRAVGIAREYQGGPLDLDRVLDHLAGIGVRTLFVEGGAEVLTGFLRRNLADTIILDIAPRFIGQGISAVRDLGVDVLAQARSFRTVDASLRGGNLIWTMEK